MTPLQQRLTAETQRPQRPRSAASHPGPSAAIPGPAWGCRTSTTSARRGTVIFIVMWAIAIAAIVVSSVQLLGYRQAMLGHDALGRVQARWAARGGIEQSIAVIHPKVSGTVPRWMPVTVS